MYKPSLSRSFFHPSISPQLNSHYQFVDSPTNCSERSRQSITNYLRQDILPSNKLMVLQCNQYSDHRRLANCTLLAHRTMNENPIELGCDFQTPLLCYMLLVHCVSLSLLLLVMYYWNSLVPRYSRCMSNK